MEKRVFENPLIKDKVTLIETSRETNGAYTLLEVELLPGGGNGPHFHKSFSEEFIPVEGNLGVVKNGKKIILSPGENARVDPKQVHNFYNPGNETIRFHVKLVPGHEGFENGIKIAYGLASDNKTNKKGVPSDFAHLGIILKLTDTGLPGFISVLAPFFRWKTKRATKKGVEQALIEQYS